MVHMGVGDDDALQIVRGIAQAGQARLQGEPSIGCAGAGVNEGQRLARRVR